MDKVRTTDLRDSKVNERIVLSGLWICMLFVFAYVDIFGFMRADVINGILDGKVSSTGLGIDQTFLTLTVLFILIPTLMVAFSLLARAKVNRVVNIVVSVLYVASIVAMTIGEIWVYYILGSVVEVAILLTITGIAWRWRARTEQSTTRPRQEFSHEHVV